MYFLFLLHGKQSVQDQITVIIGGQHNILYFVALQSELVIQGYLLQLLYGYVIVQFIPVIALHRVICISYGPHNFFVMEIIQLLAREPGQ